MLDRPGFGDEPRTGRVDFEADAQWLAPQLQPGDHLVGHSYGGIVCLLAAAERTVRSVTVIEPPAFGIARGDPAVDAAIAGAERHWAEAPREAEAFLRGFLEFVGTPWRPRSPLPPPVARGAELLMDERLPSEAEIPFDALRALGTPVLVVSGAHSAAFDAVCAVLERELRADRAILPRYGHAAQRNPDFNRVLNDFVTRAAPAAEARGAGASGAGSERK